MITGDSPQCGVHIARECGLTGKETRIYLGEFDAKQGTVVWHEMGAEDANSEANLLTDELISKVRCGICSVIQKTCVAFLTLYSPCAAISENTALHSTTPTSRLVRSSSPSRDRRSRSSSSWARRRTCFTRCASLLASSPRGRCVRFTVKVCGDLFCVFFTFAFLPVPRVLFSNEMRRTIAYP